MKLKKPWPVFIFIPSILLILAVALAKIFFEVSIYGLTVDPSAIANIHPLKGLLSNLGVLLWCGTAAICFFVAGALRQTRNYKIINFFLASACLSTYLLIDDFFQFHETLAPIYIGIPEKLVLLLIIIAIFIYFFSFWRIILQTQYGLILIASIFLAVSVASDPILNLWPMGLGEWEFLIEDGAKLLGITGWLSYYLNTAYQFLFDNFDS